MEKLANWNLHFFHLHIYITCEWLDPIYTFIFHVGYVANLKESVVRILQGIESSVLERADAPDHYRRIMAALTKKLQSMH